MQNEMSNYYFMKNIWSNPHSSPAKESMLGTGVNRDRRTKHSKVSIAAMKVGDDEEDLYMSWVTPWQRRGGCVA